MHKKQCIKNEVINFYKKFHLDDNFSCLSIAYSNNSMTDNFYFGKTSNDLESKEIDENYLFQVSSITKSYISFLVLKFVDNKICTLNDALKNWLPEYTSWGHVTLKQLLQMTSPIPSYVDEKFVENYFNDIYKSWTYKELIDLVYPELSNESWSYSNTNYILLAMIIEKISNKKLSAVLMENIFIPYGLENTFYFDDGVIPVNILERMPHTYYARVSPAIDTFGNNISYAGPSGGIIASPKDVNKWIRLLFQNKYLSEQSFKELTQLILLTGQNIGTYVQEIPEDPEVEGYGLGVSMMYSKEYGGRVWKYDAGTFGSRFMFIFNPQNKISFCIAANSIPVIHSITDNKLNLIANSIYQILNEKKE